MTPEKNNLQKYADMIDKGEIVVCEYLGREIENLLRDLSNPRYIYDTKDAERRFAFQEKFCLQSKAPYYMKPVVLMPWQKAFFESLYSFRYVDSGLRRFIEGLLLVARKNGKALSLDTRIPTPDGDKTMKDINTGDYVFNADGKPARVLATSEIFENHDCFNVEFEDGEIITADAAHIWRVREKLSHGYIWRDTTTAEIAENFAHKRKDGKGFEYKYRVQLSGAVEYPEKDLKIDPYVLGVWLGDGISDGGRIACGKLDVEEMTANIKAKTGVCDVREYPDGKIMLSVSGVTQGKRSAFVKALNYYNLKNNKHIPAEYLTASIEQRFELLRGLMDTDGTASKNGECEFVQKSAVLTRDFSALLSSLGIKHSIKDKMAMCKGKRIPVFRVLFYVDKNNTCFKLKRKTERLKEMLSERMTAKSIINVKPADSVPTKCLCVEGGLYLCGERNTVTHNSTMFAADGTTDLFVGDGGTSICCASNDDRQAKLIWREIGGMRQRLDPKKQITGQNLTEIRNRLKNIEIFRLSSKTQNKDGFNIDKTYVDESHDLQDDEITDACWRGMSSKDEPLFLNCTTQGFINGGYLDKKIDYCRKVIDGEIDDERILPFLYEQDSEAEVWADSASWEKSNPSIRYGVKKTNKLLRDLEVARHDNGAKIHMLCKDFNIKQNTAAAWLANEDYNYPQELKTFDDFRGCFALAAVDLSETTDLTNAKVLIMRQGDPTKYVFSHYWIPAGKLEKADDASAGAKYKEWARDGLLTICEGYDNNLIEVADWLANLKKLYDIKILKCGYDQRFAREFLERCEMYGIETERILQTPDVMSNPSKLVESELKAHLINYGNNPIDAWCLSNTAIKVNNYGQILAVKIGGQYSKRIDGAVTLIILYATLQRYKTEYYNLLK